LTSIDGKADIPLVVEQRALFLTAL
jgi:hypothetical protein